MAQISPNTTSQWEQEWERVLWKKKPYPDNYVPRTRFLEFLKTNGAVKTYRIRQVSHRVFSVPL